MTTRKVRLGPGGKVLMVLVGVALILWGLDAYGYLDGVKKALGIGRHPAATSVHAGGASGTAAGTGAATGATGQAPAKRARPAAAGDGAAKATTGTGAVHLVPAGAPALLGSAGTALRDGGDAMWAGTGGPDPRGRVDAVTSGRLDLAPVSLADLLVLDAGSSRLVVVGAVPPVSRYLCAKGTDPVAALVGGATVAIDRLADRVRLAFLLAAHGADPTGVDGGQGPKVWTTAAPAPAGARCVDLAALGVDGPRLVVARAGAARLHGTAYLAAARRRGALGAAARAYLLAGPGDPYGYANRAERLAALAGILASTPPPAVPKVARALLTADARGLPALFAPPTARAAPPATKTKTAKAKTAKAKTAKVVGASR